MNNYDVYIVSPNLDRPAVVEAKGTDPDDALSDCERRGNYFPKIGDRVIRCVEVNRNKLGKASG